MQEELLAGINEKAMEFNDPMAFFMPYFLKSLSIACIDTASEIRREAPRGDSFPLRERRKIILKSPSGAKFERTKIKQLIIFIQ